MIHKSAALSIGAGKGVGRFQKLISVWEGLCARPRDKILGHPVWGGPLVVEMRQCGVGLFRLGRPGGLRRAV